MMVAEAPWLLMRTRAAAGSMVGGSGGCGGGSWAASEREAKRRLTKTKAARRRFMGDLFFREFGAGSVSDGPAPSLTLPARRGVLSASFEEAVELGGDVV